MVPKWRMQWICVGYGEINFDFLGLVHKIVFPISASSLEVLIIDFLCFKLIPNSRLSRN